MNLELIQPDPLNILASTKPVVENAEHVFINSERLSEAAQKISERFAQGLDTQELGFGITDSLQDDVQLVFIEDCLNFCFWPSKSEPKWQVELPDGTVTSGGWYGLKTCFERGMKSGVPILDANYLANISFDEVEDFLRGANNTQVPLLEERTKYLQEAG